MPLSRYRRLDALFTISRLLTFHLRLSHRVTLSTLYELTTIYRGDRLHVPVKGKIYKWKGSTVCLCCISMRNVDSLLNFSPLYNFLLILIGVLRVCEKRQLFPYNNNSTSLVRRPSALVKTLKNDQRITVEQVFILIQEIAVDDVIGERTQATDDRWGSQTLFGKAEKRRKNAIERKFLSNGFSITVAL